MEPFGTVYETPNGEFINLWKHTTETTTFFEVKTNLTALYDEQGENEDWSLSIDVITSMILSHICAGVDVFSPAYKAGVANTVEQVSNHFGDN